MAQYEEHDANPHWNSMNMFETSSFGTLDDVLSITTPPSPYLIDDQDHSHEHFNPYRSKTSNSNNESNQPLHPHTITFPTSLADWPLFNTVDMEVQDNARRPTFYDAIDRSNSTFTSTSEGGIHNYSTKATRYPVALSPRTRKELNNLIRLDDGDTSWGEFFMKSNPRHTIRALDEYLADPNVFDNVATTTNNGMTDNSQHSVMNEDGNGVDYHQSNKRAATAAMDRTTSSNSIMDIDYHGHDNDHDNDHVLLNDDDLVSILVEPTLMEPIMARGAPCNLQQHPQRHHYPVAPRRSALPIPTGIALPGAASSGSNEDTIQEQQLKQSPHFAGPTAACLTASASPMSSALVTAAAIAVAAADASLNSSPTMASDPTSAVEDHPKNDITFTNGDQQVKGTNNHSDTTMFGTLSTTTEQPLLQSSSSQQMPTPNPRNQQASHLVLPALAPPAIIVTTTPAMATAVKMKSLVGFGGNHVVPSVPVPPLKPSATRETTASMKTTAVAAQITTTTPPSKHSLSTASTNPSATTTAATKQSHEKPSSENGESSTRSSPAQMGESYERKKQRAKAARVRQNEAIERLAIATSMAGSQSKQRASQIKNMSLPLSLFDNKAAALIRIMEGVNNTATNAQKWDRPSFVGVAASLIQGLNAECEALMDLVEMLMDHSHRISTARQESPLQQQLDGVVPTMLTNSSKETNAVKVETPSLQEISCSQLSFSPERSGIQVLKKKRQRVSSIPDLTLVHSDENQSVTFQAILSQTSLVQKFAFYLDPVSLLRCQQVSSSWTKAGVFSNDIVWKALSLTRFGRHQVSRWMNTATTDNTASPPSVELYRRMDEANVMPHFRQQDGMIRLGEGRIGSKVSAWAFFVKRSNGETARSVKREPRDSQKLNSECSLPVVELRIVVQNIGFGSGPIVIKNQVVTVDASTRRRGEEYRAITWDDRLRMTVRKLNDADVGDGDWDNRCKVNDPMTDPAWNDDPFKTSIWKVNGLCLPTDYSETEEPQMDTITADSQQPQKPPPLTTQPQVLGTELCRLRLFETQFVTVFVHSTGCSTTKKFQERSNFTKLLVCLNGTTYPLVIPFLREDAADGATAR